MKRRSPGLKTIRLWKRLLVLGICAFYGVGSLAPANSASNPRHTLRVEILPSFRGEPLAFDALTNSTAAGRRISITRLDFLLSGLSLARPDGTWVSETNQVAFINARGGLTTFQSNDLPSGRYEKMRFHIGLKPELNHKDPAAYPANHPLNPQVNGLHWGWMGGYVFLALEGQWIDRSVAAVPPAQSEGEKVAVRSGYSYHLATDRQLMTVELPVELDLSSDRELRLALDVDQIFSGQNPIMLNDAATSTHSRTNDSLAAQLRQNVEHAFTVNRVAAAQNTHTPTPSTRRIEMAADATPYRFTISSFFPRPALPADNPLTEQGVELGRRLFFEKRLSVNNSQSCSSCHQPELGFCETKAASTGAEGKTGARNAMPLFNLAWKSAFFWDGRAPSLREQVLQPIRNPIEMHESLANVAKKLKAIEPGSPDYPTLFARAFGASNITPDRIARALEQFLLTQTSHDSKFDRVLKGQAHFTEQEQRGFELFHTEYDPRREQFGADCFHCHGGPLFQSQVFANNGLDAEPKDLGRFLVTAKEGDKGKFSVPSLRNVELTAPYMHDGRFGTLEQVIEHYTTGLKRSATLDPNLAKHPDGGVPLSPEDKLALVAFLKTLTEERLRTRTEVAKAP